MSERRQLLTVREVAYRLKLSEKSVWRRIASGEVCRPLVLCDDADVSASAGTVFRDEAERMERMALGGLSTELSTELSEPQGI